jgi:hypothetical protein
MKKFACFFLFLTFSLFLHAQEYSSLDTLYQFRSGINPNYKHLLYDYRLPDWGYSEFFIGLGTSNSGTDREREGESDIDNSFSGRILPGYRKYFEGEKNTFRLFVHINSDYYHRRSKQKTQQESTQYRNTQGSFTFYFESTYHTYLNDLIYLHIAPGGTFSYNDDKRLHERTIYDTGEFIEDTDHFISRRYDVQLNLGIGVGRLRNINPVISALRFNERLAMITGSYELNETDIMELSRLYTRSEGFFLIYDRPKKYFYSMLPNSLQDIVKKLTPWEFLYLDDVTQEIIGDRYEGFEINFGPTLRYENRIPAPTGILFEEEHFLAGIYLDQMYYHNPTVNYQMGVLLNGSYYTSINQNTEIDQLGNVLFSFRNLWNAADRLLVQCNLNFETAFNLYKSDDQNDSRGWQRTDLYSVDMILTYYLENHLSIYSNSGYSYRHNRPDDISLLLIDDYYFSSFKNNKSWNFSVGLNYHFDRRLW